MTNEQHMPHGLLPRQVGILRQILAPYAQAITRVDLFGSRSGGRYRNNSDIDLVIHGDLLEKDIDRLHTLFQESALPFSVDVKSYALTQYAPLKQHMDMTQCTLFTKDDLVLYDAENEALQEHVRRYGKVVVENVEMHTWETYTVKELITKKVIAHPVDGNHGSIHPKSSDFVLSGIPFIMASDLDESGVNLSLCAFIAPEQARRLRKGFAKEGDVLLSHKATIGRTAVVSRIEYPYIVLTPQITYYRILNSKILDKYYLKYYFDTPNFQDTLKSWADAGSTRAYLGITAQERLPIAVPHIAVQKRIVTLLKPLDDRIQLLRETNATLEAMAQALFKSWFVDFDPVHAKAGGRTPEGMDAETAALFPAEFEESELGMIPKGWKEGVLADMCSFSKNKIPVALLTLENYYSTENILPNKSGITRASGFPSTHQVVSCKEGDTIVSNIRPYFKKIYYCLEECGCSNDVLCFSPRSHLYSLFVYSTVYDDNFFDYVVAGSTGTKMPRGDKKHILQYKIVIPDESLLQRFTECVKPFSKRIGVNAKLAQHLTALRDTLLPRLISGKLRLPEFAEIPNAQA